MNARYRALLFGLLVGTLTVAAVVVVHGLRRGWDELSEPGYWIEKAVLFVVLTAVYTVFASFQHPRRTP